MKLFFVTASLLVGFLGATQTHHPFDTIQLSTTKTVNLVFPTHVLSIDRGSNQVIVQKATPYILKVKAVQDSFVVSNLTVITVDGKLYSFILLYAIDPTALILYIGDTSKVKAVHPLQKSCDRVSQLNNHIPGMKYSAGQVALQWLGWFIKGDTLFCKIKFINRSVIGYDIDQFQLYIRDNSISRRTASQELLQAPLFISGDTGTIPPKRSRIWVIALEKFTIPDDKHFVIEALEKNGGRHLHLRSSNRLLMTAKSF